MELYITVSFWLGVTGLLGRAILMLSSFLSGGIRATETTIAEDFLLGVISLAFVGWSGYLLFA